MKEYTITLSPEMARFYENLAEKAHQTPENVLIYVLEDYYKNFRQIWVRDLLSGDAKGEG
ncbi:hypothetical protein LJC32_03565 [Oscillospiraceae bacterium OttesenSCG-928-F05]|nr:hypothetical protein [Oscillospiraceae bacterium OttesenSCG-928-F05]